MPIIPGARKLPNQIDLVGPTLSKFRGLSGVASSLEDFSQTIERVETEEARTETAELLSEAVVAQKTALSKDKEFDDPDLYRQFVTKEFERARDGAEKRATRPLTRTLLRRGLAQSEAALADEFGTRLSNLREYKAQAHIVSYLDNVKRGAAVLSPQERDARRVGAEAFILSSSAFRQDQKEKMILKFREDLDETAVLTKLRGSPDDPSFKNPQEALELLEFQNTPHLSDKRREELFNTVTKTIDRAQAKGSKVAEDVRSAKMSEFYTRIFSSKDPEEVILRDSVQAVNKREIDVHKDPDQINQWLTQRKSGVGGSHESRLQLLSDFLNPMNPQTGRPDPITLEKFARYQKLAVTTPMSDDDRVKVQSQLFTWSQTMNARQDSTAFRDLMEYFKTVDVERQNLRRGYASWIERDPMFGVVLKAEQRYTELIESGMDAKRAREQVQKEFPAKKATGVGGEEIKVGDLLEGHPSTKTGR